MIQVRCPCNKWCRNPASHSIFADWICSGRFTCVFSVVHIRQFWALTHLFRGNRIAFPTNFSTTIHYSFPYKKAIIRQKSLLLTITPAYGYFCKDRNARYFKDFYELYLQASPLYRLFPLHCTVAHHRSFCTGMTSSSIDVESIIFLSLPDAHH